MYLLRLAFLPWKMALWSQVFSALAVSFLLFCGGFLLWMQSGLKPLLVKLQQEQVVTAYLNPEVESKEEARIVDAIRVAVGAHPASDDAETGAADGVDLKFVSEEQFTARIKAQYPELARELDALGHEANRIVPRYVSVSGLLPPNAAEQIKAVTGIESVDSTKDRYSHVLGAFKALRWVSRLLTLGLLLALFTGLVHLARMNSYLHQDALAILRLWGASDWTLRSPGLLSGLAVGLFGGASAGLAWTLAGAWVVEQVRALSPLLRDLPPASMLTAILLAAAGLAIGAVSGALGTATASARTA